MKATRYSRDTAGSQTAIRMREEAWKEMSSEHSRAATYHARSWRAASIRVGISRNALQSLIAKPERYVRTIEHLY
jgi:hypothetical protein